MSGGDIVAAVLQVLKETPEIEKMVRGRIYRGAMPPPNKGEVPAIVVTLVSRTRRNVVDATDYVDVRVQITIVATDDAARCRIDEAVVLALNRNPVALRLAGVPRARSCTDAGCQMLPPTPGGTVWSLTRDFLVQYI